MTRVARLPRDWTDERGSWDIWFLTACNGVRVWQSTDGEWAGSDELNEWELIHDEGATQ